MAERAAIMPCFTVSPDGTLLGQKRVLEDWGRLADWRAGLAIAGSKGGLSRAQASKSKSKRESKSESESGSDGGAERATRIPKDFAPNDTSREMAKDLKLNLAQELIAFKDYWESKGGRHIDWSKAFYTWLRKSAEYKAKAKPQPRSSQPSFPDVTEALKRQRGEQ